MTPKMQLSVIFFLGFVLAISTATLFSEKQFLDDGQEELVELDDEILDDDAVGDLLGDDGDDTDDTDWVAQSDDYSDDIADSDSDLDVRSLADDQDEADSEDYEFDKRRWVYKCEPDECNARCLKLLKLPGGTCGFNGKCYCRRKGATK